MAKLTLTPLASLTNEESAIAAINANFDAIEAALELTYSRNNTSPNTLSGNLDMNGYRIINSGAPVDDNDIARLADMVEGVVGPQGPAGAAGGVLEDGHYVDIVVSNSGDTWTIDSALLPAYGRTLVANTTAADARTDLGLGGAAILNVGTSAGTVAAGNDTRFMQFTITAKDATGDFALNENFLYHSSASAHTFTLQPDATIALPVGVVIRVKNGVSGGNITIARGSGVSLYVNGSTTSANATIAAGGAAQLIQYATNTWEIIGANVS